MNKAQKKDLNYMVGIIEDGNREEEKDFDLGGRVALHMQTKGEQTLQELKQTLLTFSEQPPERYPGEPDERYITRFNEWDAKTMKYAPLLSHLL